VCGPRGEPVTGLSAPNTALRFSLSLPRFVTVTTYPVTLAPAVMGPLDSCTRSRRRPDERRVRRIPSAPVGQETNACLDPIDHHLWRLDCSAVSGRRTVCFRALRTSSRWSRSSASRSPASLVSDAELQQMHGRCLRTYSVLRSKRTSNRVCGDSLTCSAIASRRQIADASRLRDSHRPGRARRSPMSPCARQRDRHALSCSRSSRCLRPIPFLWIDL